MLCFQGGYTLTCLLLRSALHRLVSQTVQIFFRDRAEGHQVQFLIELRKINIPVFSGQAAEHTQFARFLRRYEIPAHIARCRDRLVLFQASVEAVQKTPVGKRYVGETCRRYRHFQTAAVQIHLHDAFRSSHHVNGIGRLIGRNAEILLCSAFLRLQHRTVRVEDIGIDHTHQRVRILLGTHMF